MNRSIAFYAPMKPPNHSVPSGDRTIARGLMNALRDFGDVELVSEFQSRDGEGNTARQAELVTQADVEIDRLLSGPTPWGCWLTYHNYYKAPDLIGPKVSAVLGIPYYAVEASRSPKRLQGRWAEFAKRADVASDAAQAIFYFTERDAPALLDARPEGQELVHLKPFLDREDVPELPMREGNNVLLAVGMLRDGDKLASYKNLAAALSHVNLENWSLRIVGGGEAEVEVRELFAPFAEKVTFTGELDAKGVAQEMAAADVFVWPGVNEAFGMVYLEAQAAGMAVVAEDRVGVRDVVGPDSQLAAKNDPAAFALAIERALRARAQSGHQSYIVKNHLRGSAVRTFAETLNFQVGEQ